MCRKVKSYKNFYVLIYFPKTWKFQNKTFNSFCFINFAHELTRKFSFRSRGIAAGFAASFCYILGFIGRKTYYNLESMFSLAGSTFVYCIICGLGLIVMYLILPETENISLEDIELHFSDNSKKLTDRIIAKSHPNTLFKDAENSIKNAEYECTKF